jgi:hypothetical protein
MEPIWNKANLPRKSSFLEECMPFSKFRRRHEEEKKTFEI